MKLLSEGSKKIIPLLNANLLAHYLTAFSATQASIRGRTRWFPFVGGNITVNYAQ